MSSSIVNTDDDLGALQAEMQRRLGLCMLQVQQYERLMKLIVANHRIGGSLDDFESAASKRRDEIATRTLGMLVRELLDSCVVVDRDAGQALDPVGSNPDGAFEMSFRIKLAAVDSARIRDGLGELVDLRNRLVHHLSDDDNLWSIEGCRDALESLDRSRIFIKQHYDSLRLLAVRLDSARLAAADFVKSDAFCNLIDGIAPDGNVHWPSSAIVAALRDASVELALDGWTRLADAARWITDRYPQQIPARYGCRRWRQVVHEARAFELRYRTAEDGSNEAWYR